jgi:hypothetical protein
MTSFFTVFPARKSLCEGSHSGSLLSIKMNGYSFIAMVRKSYIIEVRIEP